MWAIIPASLDGQFLWKKVSQRVTHFFKNILNFSDRKPVLIERDGGKQFVNKIFTNLLNKNNIKRYSKNASLAALFADKFDKTSRDLLKRPD